MRKVSKPYQESGKSGWWIRWQEDGRRVKKSLPTKSLAEHFAHVQYQRINSDVYTSSISYPWETAVTEYLEHIKIRCRPASYKISKSVLARFETICLPATTVDINQRTIDRYIKDRFEHVKSPYTLNKDIQRLKTFAAWLKKQKYSSAEIKVEKFKEPAPAKSSLSDEQIEKLLVCCPSRQWQLKIILCLCTGLRKSDLYKLPRLAIKFESAWLDTSELKTGKVLSQPIPEALIDALTIYDQTMNKDRCFFWQKINKKKLDEQFREFRPFKVTIQDLRKTYSTRIESTGISTLSLGHSSAQVTRKFYNDLDAIRFIRVNQLPVEKWLSVPFKKGD